MCRTTVAKTGEMFVRYGASGLDTHYGYNDRSEVISEVTKLGGTSTVLTGREDAYAFDNIGNRASTAGTTHNGTSADYTTNNLNQYTQRTVAGNVDVSGLAPSASTVTVNGSSTSVTRQGDWYFKGFGVTSPSNTSNAVWPSLTVASSLGGSEVRNAFVALTPEAFAYDLDGNLTSDGRWDYTYDAENRLVSMQTHSTTTAYPIANADARRIEFKNDYLGRRVEKTVRSGWNGSSFTTVVSDLKFLYDGWNLLREMDAANSLATVRGYVWGLDWSGTLQGAGGVGGLLHERDAATATSLRAAYDGNGNLMGLVSTTDGTMAAAYEYDAFGQTLRATGTHATGNPFRFSTKYTDTETGLVYYGLRYYSPVLGRFPNQDPIAEQGGLNLYAFCGNNGVNKWDYLGNKLIWLPDDDASFGDYGKEERGRWEYVPDNFEGDYWDYYIANLQKNFAASPQPQNPNGAPTAPSSALPSPDSLRDPFTGDLWENPTPGDSNFQPTAPNSEVTFWGEFGKEAREFGPRTADRIAEGAKQGALWVLDVFNAGGQLLYGEPVGSEQRWKPQSVYTTDASITSKQILISTADAATFGIPAGTYKIVTGDYRGAQDAFGGGALVLISADLAGVRSPTIEFTSPRANLLVIRGLDVVSDGTVLGRLPDPRTAQAPMDPPAITLTVGSKPTAGAGGRGK